MSYSDYSDDYIPMTDDESGEDTETGDMGKDGENSENGSDYSSKDPLEKMRELDEEAEKNNEDVLKRGEGTEYSKLDENQKAFVRRQTRRTRNPTKVTIDKQEEKLLAEGFGFFRLGGRNNVAYTNLGDKDKMKKLEANIAKSQEFLEEKGMW